MLRVGGIFRRTKQCRHGGCAGGRWGCQPLETNNAFARYGLAMEHIGQGSTDQGLAEFTSLIALNPDYVPAYQMSAQTLAKLSRTEEALARLHEGIGAANRTG